MGVWSQLRQGVMVRTSDGRAVGRIARCDPDGFVIARGPGLTAEFGLDYNDVAGAKDGEVWLRCSAAEVVRKLRPERRAVGRARRGPTGMTLAEEQVEVEKVRRQVGEARVRTRVETRKVEADVPVLREEARVERVEVPPRPAGPGEVAFEERTVELPLRAERVDVRERPVVSAEVRVRTSEQSEEVPVSAEARREVVQVEEDTESGATKRRS
jgi:uncharacterized protein (TIGR02271 family)